jgi:hypothetical protein
VALITFKVNIMPLCLISLYAAYTFFAQKQYRRVVFAFAGSFLIVALWLGRNVILSGYLVFPFSEIDLFAVDWKIPEQIAVEERDFIRSCGIRLFNDTINQLKIFDLSVEGIKGWLISFIFAGFAIISPVVVLYSCLRKKYLNKTVYLVYVSLLLIFLTWYIGGPDPRFIGGTLFAMVYIVMHLLLPGKKEIKLIRTGRVMIALFVLIMATWPMTRTGRFSGMFGLSTHTEGMRPVSNVLIRPYPYRELLKSAGIYKDDFHIYDFSKDVFVYISESPEILNGRYVCFDSPFPCTVSASGAGIKYLDVTGIEPRGGSLQKGFRVKK